VATSTLATYCLKTEKVDEAITIFNKHCKSSRLRGSSYDLGNALLQKGKLTSNCSLHNTANQPDYAKAHNNLGTRCSKRKS